MRLRVLLYIHIYVIAMYINVEERNFREEMWGDLWLWEEEMKDVRLGKRHLYMIFKLFSAELEWNWDSKIIYKFLYIKTYYLLRIVWHFLFSHTLNMKNILKSLFVIKKYYLCNIYAQVYARRCSCQAPSSIIYI